MNHLNLGGGGCGGPRSCYCTPAWVTGQDFASEKKIHFHSVIPPLSLFILVVVCLFFLTEISNVDVIKSINFVPYSLCIFKFLIFSKKY